MPPATPAVANVAGPTLGPMAPRGGPREFDRLPLWQNAWRLALAWAFGLIFGLMVYGTTTASFPERLPDEGVAAALVLLDVVVGHLTVAVVAFRRRWPVTCALLALALSAVSPTSLGSVSLAVMSLATQRRPRPLLAAAVVNGLAGTVHERFLARWVFPEGMEYTVGTGLMGSLINLALATMFFAVVALIGWNVGSRRELVRSWQTQAATVMSEQAARVAQAQLAERARIAREMHDVLAHRLSLVAMHAGVLAHRTDLSEAERREAAEVVRAGAHQALQELREVLGVLREDVGESSGTRVEGPGDGSPGAAVAGARVEAPQPGLSGIPGLVAEVTSSGHPVRLETDPELWPRSVSLPPSTGRHAYRVVQEALTNARKHAPGELVTVQVAGRPGEGLSVVAANRAGEQQRTALPSGGRGLTGMAERAQLAGGRFEAGVEVTDFVVRAWFPWPVQEQGRMGE